MQLALTNAARHVMMILLTSVVLLFSHILDGLPLTLKLDGCTLSLDIAVPEIEWI